MNNWKDTLGGSEQQPEDTVTPEQAQSAWEHFVTHVVLPTFEEFHSTPARIPYLAGTTYDIQQAPAGERWVRLTWTVRPSPHLVAQMAKFMRDPGPPPPPQTVLTFTIMDDEHPTKTTAWCEARIPADAGDQTSRERVFREVLGDYRGNSVTKDAILQMFVEMDQRRRKVRWVP